MVLEVALHGDGNYRRYLGYGKSSSAGGHSAAEVARFVLWFWWPRANAWAAPVLLGLAAAGLTWRLRPGPARSFCRSLLAFDVLATALVVAYTVAGVDEIDQQYIGYFAWATPVIALLVILVALSELPSGLHSRTGARAGLALAGAAALAAGCAFAVAPATRTSTADVDPLNPQAGQPTNPALAKAVATMGELAAGRTIVLLFPHNAWPYVTGILVQAERTGVRACVKQPSWAFMMSKADICTGAELRAGYRMAVYDDPEIPPGADPVAYLQRAIVTSGTK